MFLHFIVGTIGEFLLGAEIVYSVAKLALLCKLSSRPNAVEEEETSSKRTIFKKERYFLP